jgi:hypothetical protein
MADAIPPRDRQDDPTDCDLLWARHTARERRGSAAKGVSAYSLIFNVQTGPGDRMYVALSHNETRQNFNVWVYGADKKLVRGSGLFVSETGVEANHHFLTPRDDNSFRFTEGRYTLDVFARLLGDSGPIRLFSQTLEISRETAGALAEPHAGVYFDWGPDSSRYLPHIETRPPSPDPEKFLEALGLRP